METADPNVSQRAARDRNGSGGFMETDLQYDSLRDLLAGLAAPETQCRPAKCSEGHSGGNLNLPRVQRSRHRSKRSSIRRGIRKSEIRMIERIKELAAELNSHLFGKPEIPGEGEVHILETGAPDHIPSSVAEGVGRRPDECGHVEVLRDGLRPRVRVAGHVRPVCAGEGVA